MAIIITGAVISEGRNVLLVQEGKEGCKGLWSLPAGHLEADEVLTEGAVREVREETGLEVELTGIAKIGSIPIPGTCMVNVMFTASVIGGELKVDGEEILDVRWFTYDEIKDMRDVLRAPEWTMEVLDNYMHADIAPMSLIGYE